jgi:hypothetical protein
MLTTIGEACRAVKGELLPQLVDWIVEKLADDHWSVPQIKAVLAKPNLAAFGQIAKVQSLPPVVGVGRCVMGSMLPLSGLSGKVLNRSRRILYITTG